MLMSKFKYTSYEQKTELHIYIYAFVSILLITYLSNYLLIYSHT